MAAPDRWEHGSDFAYPDALACEQPSLKTHLEGGSHAQSGRDALRALIDALRPRRVLLPSFYCQDVIDACRVGPAAPSVRCYPDAPTDELRAGAMLAAAEGDLVVVCNTLGLRVSPPVDVAALIGAGAVVVEDHTHDPFSLWAQHSQATYAFASLRKWLPLPDGAVLWSPHGAFVPTIPREAEADIGLARLSAMLLKQRYLRGEAVEKAAFRELAADSEAKIGRGPEPRGMSRLSRQLLELFPIESWRVRRRENFLRLADVALGAAELLRPATGEAVPYAATFVFASHAERERVRRRLIEASVYPAVLWTIDANRVEGIRASDVALGERSLSIHCDHRYARGDMDRVCAELERAAAGAT